jgi:hypothetical protein
MPGLDPGIHRFSQQAFCEEDELRIKPGNDRKKKR